MSLIIEQVAADRQVAEAIAAEYESLSLACRADAARLERLLAPDFHEFGASGGEIGYEGTAELVAESTDPDGEPIKVERMRGQLLADGLVHGEVHVGEPQQARAPDLAVASPGARSLAGLPSSRHDRSPLTGDRRRLRVRVRGQRGRLGRLGQMATVCVHMHLIHTMPFHFGDFPLRSVTLCVA